MNAGSAGPNIVLVHGGFVDGSGWRAAPFSIPGTTIPQSMTDR
ncbi:MAG TPA: hypothetical protein VG476_12890 [Acidimicrobiales bacterium]|nr:hypothetical protein [Acidimicrobiales bacterium]